MRYSSIVALAMGNLAAAQFANSSTSAIDTATGTETQTGATGTSTAGPVASVGNFEYLGCLASSDNFPTFRLAYSSEDNDYETCAASCSTSEYFGVFTNDCYCGDEVRDSETTTVGDDECSIPCPADESQSCGGLVSNDRLARRQNVAVGVLLSIFINVEINAGSTSTVTDTLSAEVTTTATSTFTEDGTTATTTMTTVIGLPTDIIIICYGNYCSAQSHCPVCTKYQVVCRDNSCKPEVCHDNTYDRLKICHGDECYYSDCHGDECGHKVVCQGNVCKYNDHHDDGKKEYVCHGDECKFETCHGDECYSKKECSGEHCVVVPNKPMEPEHPYTPAKPTGGDNKPMKPEHPETPAKPTGDNNKPVEPETPAKPTGGDNKPVTPTGDDKVVCIGDHCPEKPVIVSGSGKMIPAVGLAAAIAGVAFLL